MRLRWIITCMPLFIMKYCLALALTVACGSTDPTGEPDASSPPTADAAPAATCATDTGPVMLVDEPTGTTPGEPRGNIEYVVADNEHIYYLNSVTRSVSGTDKGPNVFRVQVKRVPKAGGPSVLLHETEEGDMQTTGAYAYNLSVDATHVAFSTRRYDETNVLHLISKSDQQKQQLYSGTLGINCVLTSGDTVYACVDGSFRAFPKAGGESTTLLPKGELGSANWVFATQDDSSFYLSGIADPAEHFIARVPKDRTTPTLLDRASDPADQRQAIDVETNGGRVYWYENLNQSVRSTAVGEQVRIDKQLDYETFGSSGGIEMDADSIYVTSTKYSSDFKSKSTQITRVALTSGAATILTTLPDDAPLEGHGMASDDFCLFAAATRNAIYRVRKQGYSQ